MIKKYIENIVREMLEDKKDRFWEGVVFCADCGVILRIEKAHKVISRDIYSCSTVIPQLDETKYYCDRHRKKYDKVEIITRTHQSGKFIEVIFKYIKDNIEVDENGKIIK
jgi:hypothetical protein